MIVDVHTQREGDFARLVPAGPFDLGHAAPVAEALLRAQSTLAGCHAVEVDLAKLDGVDSTGAVQLARLLDRLEANGLRTQVTAVGNQQAARLIALYRKRKSVSPVRHSRAGALTRIGESATQMPSRISRIFNFVGNFSAALPKAVAAPRSVDWGSLPRLIQEAGADSLPVTGAANLLVGFIIAVLGVAQLGRFGAVAFVPELVVVTHFRELGPLVTAIVVAGRSGAGFASEIATMKVSEEVDALRSMGFDPMRWLVVPRCLVMVMVVPLLTWIGDILAIFGGLVATTTVTNMTPRAYAAATAQAITGVHLMSGLIKVPFLALAIALIACGQGLATQGGAAGVGARTTRAVVLSILAVIVINSIFTVFYAVMGI